MRNLRRCCIFVCVGGGLTVSGAAGAAVPACAGPSVAAGRISAVTADGTLRLANGQSVRLAGLRQPDPAALRPLRGKAVVLHAPAPVRDRYGRLRAQVADTDGNWWQHRLLAAGAAMVALSADRFECATDLYAAEGQARAARRGLWAADPVRTPDTVRGDGRFQIVEGRVLSAAKKNGRVYLNFGTDWKTDFTATVSPADMKLFRRLKVKPLRLQGHIVRVRGIVQSYRGPEIEISTPYQIETVL